MTASLTFGYGKYLEPGGRTERLLRKAASKGVLHKRTVSRTVSRLAKLAARV